MTTNKKHQSIYLFELFTILLINVREHRRKHVSQVTDKVYQIMLYRVHPPWAGFELTTLAMISNDWKCGSNSNNDHDHDGPLNCFPPDFVMLCKHTKHALFNRYALTDVKYFGVIHNSSNYHYIHVGTPFLLLQLMVFSCSYYLNLYPTHSCWLYICNVEKL